MQLNTNQYRLASGWAEPLATALDGPQSLVLVFGASEFASEQRPFDELAAAFPDAVIAGCSTSGEMTDAQVHDASISVAVARFAHTRLKLAVTEVSGPADSGAAGERLAAQLCGEPDLCAVFVLSDGLCVNGTPLVAALARHLPPGVTITGGLAGDGDRFVSTWVLARGVPRRQHISAVGFYGQRLQIGLGCDGGWKDFGPERRITRSEGNVLFELDGKPALDLYKDYLGQLAQGLPGTALLFPLSIRRPESTATPVVRTILGVDESRRSLTFAGDVPQGWVGRLMRTSDDGLIGSAAVAVAQATQGLSARSDALVVSVSCVGRRLVLGERTDEEVETIVAGSPQGSAHVGFYSYGEISPGVDGGASELHNQTMTVTVFSET